MQIDAMRDSVRVRMGPKFDAGDVARLEEAVAALGPLAHIDIDFAAVRQSDDAALARLADALASIGSGEVALHGLTMHQSRLLTYLGVDLTSH